jgi:hypothetical protein
VMQWHADILHTKAKRSGNDSFAAPIAVC